MGAIGTAQVGAGRIYFTGGACAVLIGWRDTTIDMDLKLDPEPAGVFERIAELKESLDVNIELASPDQFLPELPQWRERSVFIERHGEVDFFHYDFFSQALAKIERGHGRDAADVEAMIERGLVERPKLWSLFCEIEKQLLRFPAVDAGEFRARVAAVTDL